MKIMINGKNFNEEDVKIKMVVSFLLGCMVGACIAIFVVALVSV